MLSRKHYLSIYSSVFLLSGSALAYEVLLMRLFSIIHWHHFAYMVIGLALLGYGVSGTLVSLFQQQLIKRFNLIYPLAILLFALSSLVCFMLAQQIPFNAEVILWDSWQLWYLLLLFLLLAIPFFFAATAICLAFMQYQQNTGQIYAADLVGAGMGSLIMVALLFWLWPQQVLLVISLISLLGAAIMFLSLKETEKTFLGWALLLTTPLILILGTGLELKMSPYKSLQQSLQVSGSRIISQSTSPLGLLSLVQNDSVPFRYAPGLSLNTQGETLPQIALFTDGANMTVLNQYHGQKDQLTYFDFMTSALPYHLTPVKSTLIVGGGGGSDLLQAAYHQVPDISVLELNPQIVELVNQSMGDYTGRPYSHIADAIHIKDVRDHLESNNSQYDLIQMSLVEASNTSSSGLHALNESYLYTKEAIQLYQARLKTNGYLAFTRWITLPPRDTLKLMNTVVNSLRDAGVNDIEKRILLIRGWQTATLVMKKGVFNKQEIDRLKHFTQQRSFDLAWYGDITTQETNRYNRLASPLFYRAAQQMLSEQNGQFVEDYKFNLEPATDDKPFFHFYFKWATFKELFQLREQGGMPLMEWAYLVLVASLVIAVLSSVILIVLPLSVIRQQRNDKDYRVKTSRVVVYFFAIGLAFLMIEIAFIQKFMLFLLHPIYSIALTLSAFLVFAGIGSQSSKRLALQLGTRRLLMLTSLGILALGLLYLFALSSVFSWFAGNALWGRMIISILLIAPLAFLMGVPFPLALASLTAHAPQYIPWAWGINGCASVISASLSTLIAINYGFSMVILIAVLIYLSIPVFYPGRQFLKI